MSKGLRRVVVVASHVLALAAGFVALSAVAGREAASRSLGTAEKRLGGTLMALAETPSRETAAQGLSALAVSKAEVGEPTASVLELRILAAAARASRDEADLERATHACQARRWPKCDRTAIFAMGAGR